MLNDEKDLMIFNVSKELEYSVAGEFLKTATLEIKAPCSLVLDEVLDLSQMVMGAMLSTRNSLKEEIAEAVGAADEASLVDDSPDVDSVKALLFSGQSIKVSDIRKKFDSVVLKSGTFDGKTPITATTLKQLSLADYTGLMCEYIANFIIPSLV